MKSKSNRLKKFLFLFLFSSAFFSGIFFNLYAVPSGYFKNYTLLCSNFSSPGDPLSLDNAAPIHAKEIPINKKEHWGRQGKGFFICTKNLLVHRKKDGWRTNYIRKKLQFFLPRQKEKNPRNSSKEEKSIHAGDFFIYQIPKGYSLGNDFTNGEIRRGSHPMIKYQKKEKDGTEILVCTFTEYAILYSYFGNVSGHIILEISADS